MTLERIITLLVLGLFIIGGVVVLALGVVGTMYLIISVILVSGLVWWWPRRRWHALSVIAPPNLGSSGRVHNLFFSQLLFTSESHGLAFGHTNNPYDSRVFTTTDGGAHWRASSVLGGGTITDVNLSPDRGIFLLQCPWDRDQPESRGRLVKVSEDNGLSWKAVSEIEDATGLSFFDSTHGFTWGWSPNEDPDESERWFVKYTHDCGKSWTTLNIPADADLSFGCGAQADGSFFYIYKSNLVRLRPVSDGQWREDN